MPFASYLPYTDYIYFCGLDEVFISKYSEAFKDPSKIVDGKIYKVVDADSKIKLEYTCR